MTIHTYYAFILAEALASHRFQLHYLKNLIEKWRGTFSERLAQRLFCIKQKQEEYIL